MIAISDLHKTAREYLRAAKLLRTRRSYDVAVYLCGYAIDYLCGYAIEIALKARVCRTLHWTTGFPERGKEFDGKSSLKTHDLDFLLDYTGIQDRVRSPGLQGFLADWSVVTKWNPEERYNPRGTKTWSDVDSMIASTQILLGVLL